jgi:ATP-dependent Lon protease
MAEEDRPESEDEVEVVEPDLDGVDSPPRPEDQKLVLARDVLPTQLPIIPITDRPLFPKMTVPMILDDEPLVKMMIEIAESESRFVGIVLQRPTEGDEPREGPVRTADIYETGVVAEVIRMAQFESQPELHVMLTVLDRFHIEGFVQETPHIIAKVHYMFESEMTDNQELKAYSVSVIKDIKALVKLNPLYKEELSIFMSHSNLQDPGRLADFAAALTTSSGKELQDILRTVRIRERLRKVLVLLKREIEISELQVKISQDIEHKMSTTQREFFLREQLKAIKKELGIEKGGKETEVERFEKRIETLTLPEDAKQCIEEELEKLKMIEPSSPEFNVTRSYLDWLTVLPWGIYSEDSYDITQAETILNEDHYGLEDVKERILEFLSVGILKGNVSGSIICFVGPPGVGKTSIGKSIARSIDRSFYRFSLGGMRDEAEIKGHRRTYIGAMPGKFIQAMKICKTANPVIMLDEIDKVGASYHGDPASALLEVLDPEQNCEFLDHYLDVRFDLSNVFFICTANQVDTIPRALLDRMEVIKLSGYILQEKLEIAKRYLIPKQLKNHGLKRSQVTITVRALREMIDGYAREPGVRGLENHIKKIMRKVSKRIVATEVKKVKVDVGDVIDFIGQRLFMDENYYTIPRPGVVMGLAWTSMGGDTLYIEAAKVRTGKSGFKQTGQLGDVMVESSEIAYTYLRAFLDEDEAAHHLFETHSIHLHVPAGATPKDGPSAGITMAIALYSLVRNIPVKRHLAMTGELSLTGLVMPIGGLKEKAIAAKRAKVKHLVFPAENKKDFDELPDHIKKGLTPYFVHTFKEVVDICFGRKR